MRWRRQGQTHRRAGRRPLVIGLTGSIGMGKSAVAAMLEQQGVPVFDADAEVHRLQGPGGALVPLIEARFPGTTDAHGVNRQKLGAIVLGNKTELVALEHLVYPVVAQSRQHFLRTHAARDLVCLDIPLLFEKGGARDCDVIVVVSAPIWKQRQRVLARPTMTEAKFRAIRRLQMPNHAKRARADVIINTGLLLSETRTDVRLLINLLRAGRRHSDACDDQLRWDQYCDLRWNVGEGQQMWDDWRGQCLHQPAIGAIQASDA